MLVLSTFAAQQLSDLETHFIRLGRSEAVLRLTEAVRQASARIEQVAGPFLDAPRPYPHLSVLGWQWLHQHRYWIAFTSRPGEHVVMAIFYDTANIPGRLP